MAVSAYHLEQELCAALASPHTMPLLDEVFLCVLRTLVSFVQLGQPSSVATRACAEQLSLRPVRFRRSCSGKWTAP